MSLIKPTEINIIMGDFNAKVGRGRREDIVEDYGLGVTNERGNCLAQFCREEELITTNTHFQQPLRHLYTWVSNVDRNIRNRIDYIIINKRFKNTIKRLKTCPGADVFTDHSLLVATFNLKLKRCKRSKTLQRLNIRQILDPLVRTEIQQELNAKFDRI